jgi:hypothetical protein
MVPADLLWLATLTPDACVMEEVLGDLEKDMGVAIDDESFSRLYPRNATLLDFVRLIQERVPKAGQEWLSQQ